jgi:hypothetical protein
MRKMMTLTNKMRMMMSVLGKIQMMKKKKKVTLMMTTSKALKPKNRSKTWRSARKSVRK